METRTAWSSDQKGEILNKILEQQKQKVEATKQGLENATRAYENGGKKIQEMEKACTAQEEKLEELNRTYQAGQSRNWKSWKRQTVLPATR